MSVINITDENFADEVLNYNGTVLLDFWGRSCCSCLRTTPIIHAIAAERPDIKVGMANVSEQMGLAYHFDVMHLPTILVIQNGQEVNRTSGNKSKEFILSMLP